MYKQGYVSSGYFALLRCLLLAAVFMPALTATSSSAGENFYVSGFSPQGLVSGPANIRIEFSEPVIASGDIGQSPDSKAMPVVFSPQIRGQGVWISRQTFMYQLPDGYLPEATEYAAVIPDGVRDFSGSPISGTKTFKFSTEPLKFLGIRQVDYRADREVTYELSFNAPVSAGLLEKAMSVKDAKGENVQFYIASSGVGASRNITARAVPGDGSPITVGISAGLASEAGPLAMKTPVSVTVDRDLSMKITGSDVERYSREQRRIVIHATAEINGEKAAEFIDVAPKRDFQASTYGSDLYITGDFPPREAVTVKLKQGLPAIYGEGLAEAWEKMFILPDYEPELEFAANGRFLSPANGELLIPFSSVNIKELSVMVNRLYDNNVSFITSTADDFISEYWFDSAAEQIYWNIFNISAEPNERSEFSVDLGKILNGKTGLFSVSVRDNNNYWPQRSRVINVTDLAGSAKIGMRGALIWVNSISKGEPVKDVTVELYSSSNQIVASGRTDENGALSMTRDADWHDNLHPSVAILRKDGDVSVLRLSGNIWRTGAEDYTGVPYGRAKYTGFVYTPRGIFRPGETVPLRLMVRAAGLSPEKPFPVQLKIYNPMGREWSVSTVMTSDFGMASADVKLGDAGPTGAWWAHVLIPGERSPIASGTFLVEDFAPPKIEVTVSSDLAELNMEDSPTLNIFAKYLFGAAGSELDYEVETTLFPRQYTHPSWPDYSFFSDYRVESASSNNIEATGKLSNDGAAEVSLPEITSPAKSIIDAVFRVGVKEDGGRWVYKTVTLPYYPRNMLLGIKSADTNLSANTKTLFAFAAVDTKGSPLNPSGVTLTVAREITRNITTAHDGSRRSELQTETVPLEGFNEKPIQFSDGKASAELSFSAYGTYIVAITDKENDVSAAARFYVYDSRWDYDDESGMTDATLSESLIVKPGRDTYKTGDKAVVTVTGSFDGTALLTVETDRVMYYATAKTKGKSAEFSFDVTNDMMPNAWVTAHVIRAASPEDAWSAHRAFGASPLFVDCGELKLGVDVTIPEKIRPGETNIFKVKLTDFNGNGTPGEFSIMLVDDGVLGLTNFHTPNYYDIYTRRRALTLSAYDIYTELLPLYLKTPPVLTAGGGDDGDYAKASMLKASLSPVKANRFKILTVVMDVKTGADGTAEVAMDVPEFSGRARLMTVAASRGAFGASETAMPVARDVVADITLPRALAPSDTFDSEIQLFNRTDVSIDTAVTLKIEGPVSLALAGGEKTPAESDAEKLYRATVSVPPGEGAFSMPLSMRAGGDAGVAKMTLTTEYGEIAQSQDIELAVRPPYPRISMSGAVSVKPKTTSAIDLPASWFPGTRRALVSASGLPAVSLTDAARFLADYPYWCLEQTVSRGWALLAAPELAAGDIVPEMTKSEMSEVMRKIQSMQLYNGAFSLWETSAASQWLTAYAAHFLVACEKEGMDVPRETLNDALKYLRVLMAETPESSDRNTYGAALATRAYIAYVLSQKGEAPLAWMSYLKSNLSSMPEYGRLLLAAAYASSDKKTAALMIGKEAPPIAAYDGGEPLNYDSPLRTQALRLFVWNEIDPASSNAVSAATKVLNSLREARYYTTQEAGWSLIALSRFYASVPSKGSAVLTLLSTSCDVLAIVSGDESVNQRIAEGLNALKVKNSGSGAGYISWTADGVPTEAPAPENTGMNVSVRYFDSKGLEIFDGSIVKNGERITGKIIIRPLGSALRDIVAALPLAGGLEIENPKLSQAGDSDGNGDDEGYYDNNPMARSSRAEIRDDRLLLFVDYISKEFTWEFAMRAITPGTFVLPPIAAEGMYSPGIRSIGATSHITVK